MNCVDCGQPARNKCNRCGRRYCSNCKAEAGGNKTCGQCRLARRNASQQAKSAQRQSRHAQSQIAQQVASTQGGAYTPPPTLAAYANPGGAVVGATPPSLAPSLLLQPVGSNRQTLHQMSDADFRVWRDKREEDLRHMIEDEENYLVGRRARGIRTGTDLAKERKIALLKLILDEYHDIHMLRTLANVEDLTQQGQQHSGGTGMLITYDDMKLKP